jgi:hypothetical protein
MDLRHAHLVIFIDCLSLSGPGTRHVLVNGLPVGLSLAKILLQETGLVQLRLTGQGTSLISELTFRAMLHVGGFLLDSGVHIHHIFSLPDFIMLYGSH